jgi:chorismate mutase / prephenate dehydratase
MNIPEHRKAIDKLDTHIVRLLNERTKHVLAIGEIKLKAGDAQPPAAEPPAP